MDIFRKVIGWLTKPARFGTEALRGDVLKVSDVTKHIPGLNHAGRTRKADMQKWATEAAYEDAQDSLPLDAFILSATKARLPPGGPKRAQNGMQAWSSEAALPRFSSPMSSTTDSKVTHYDTRQRRRSFLTTTSTSKEITEDDMEKMRARAIKRRWSLAELDGMDDLPSVGRDALSGAPAIIVPTRDQVGGVSSINRRRRSSERVLPPQP
mmetsp:Transcript_40545/g.96010  ORF Transcript_40545/g.96010 Transcript_40545/m.96010 type:complete len:210 (+) Transcript_40545:33-662(+)